MCSCCVVGDSGGWFSKRSANAHCHGWVPSGVSCGMTYIVYILMGQLKRNWHPLFLFIVRRSNCKKIHVTYGAPDGRFVDYVKSTVQPQLVVMVTVPVWGVRCTYFEQYCAKFIKNLIRPGHRGHVLLYRYRVLTPTIVVHMLLLKCRYYYMNGL